MLKDLAAYLTLEKAQVGWWFGGQARVHLSRYVGVGAANVCAVRIAPLCAWWRACSRGITPAPLPPPPPLCCSFSAVQYSTAPHTGTCTAPVSHHTLALTGTSAPHQLQRAYGFNAAQHGITDAQAAEIATVFSAFDADDNGLLSLDEFQRVW